MKKWLCLLLSLMLLFSMAACKKTAEKEDESQTTVASESETTKETTQEQEEQQYEVSGKPPLAKEKETLSIVTHSGIGSNFKPPSNDLPYYKELERITNVHMEWEVINTQTYVEVISTRLAAGVDLPDIVNLQGVPLDEKYRLGPNGVIQPMNDLMEKYAPNITKWLSKKENKVFNAFWKSSDGQIYFISAYWLPSTLSGSIIYCKPWLDKLGVDVPETTDEFYSLLKEYKETDMNGNGEKDAYPLSVDHPWWLGIMGNPFGLELCYGYGWHPDENGEMACDYTSERYREYLTYMRKLYAEGLLDREYFNGNTSTNIERAANDQMGVVIGHGQGVMGYCEVHPKWDDEKKPAIFVPEIPLKGPRGYQYYLKLITIPGDECAISKNCKKPDVAMKWIDFVFGSEEAQTLQYWGVEGLTYKVENGKKVELLPDPSKSFSTNLNEIGAGQPPFCHRQSEEAILRNLPGWLSEANERQQPYYQTPLIRIPFNDEEKEIQQKYKSDVDSYVDEMTAKFINGEEPIENFDNYVKGLKKMGVDELTKIYASMHERFKIKLGQ